MHIYLYMCVCICMYMCMYLCVYMLCMGMYLLCTYYVEYCMCVKFGI